MTCIIGFIDRENDRVLIGGDSLGSNGYVKARNMAEKVFRSATVPGIVMGSTSTFRHIDLLKYSEKIFPEIDKYKETEIDHEYMVKSFIPKVTALFQEGVPSYKEQDRGANFLVGTGSNLYEIQEDYSVLIPEKFTAVGCGEQVAMGSLIATTSTRKDFSAEEHILTALKAAEMYCCGVAGPFVILSSKGDKKIVTDWPIDGSFVK